MGIACAHYNMLNTCVCKLLLKWSFSFIEILEEENKKLKNHIHHIAEVSEKVQNSTEEE